MVECNHPATHLLLKFFFFYVYFTKFVYTCETGSGSQICNLFTYFCDITHIPRYLKLRFIHVFLKTCIKTALPLNV